MRAISLGLALVLSSATLSAEYRGNFTPDAEYVLSGQLARDLPPLPKDDSILDQRPDLVPPNNG